jgi:hypothetical protein
MPSGYRVADCVMTSVIAVQCASDSCERSARPVNVFKVAVGQNRAWLTIEVRAYTVVHEYS